MRESLQALNQSAAVHGQAGLGSDVSVLQEGNCEYMPCLPNGASPHLISQRTKQILHRLSIILPILSQVLNEEPIEAHVPIVSYDVVCLALELDEYRVARVAAHDLEAIRCVL